ncbi:MAG: hypothetical protein ACRDGH_12130, partial [Candidatus Limnocylindria bacterium]
HEHSDQEQHQANQQLDRSAHRAEYTDGHRGGRRGVLTEWVTDATVTGARIEGGSSPMSNALRRAELVIWVGLAAVGLGLAVLIVYSWVEYLNNPEISIVDGYWIGRIPWIPIGVVLVLAGTAASLLGGSVAALIRGDWVRRVLLVPVLAMPILWWLTILGVIPFPRYQPVDPVTFAYSLPTAAAVMLIVPAVAIAALVLLPIRPNTRVRLRPVHPPT